mmetsp:Transcript_16699/g.54368  ORF Transcript_16699/g.54368 Transcript_16699/m.54368 type:complete len:92 (-) Transcript_16699:720-995(-)
MLVTVLERVRDTGYLPDRDAFRRCIEDLVIAGVHVRPDTVAEERTPRALAAALGLVDIVELLDRAGDKTRRLPPKQKSRRCLPSLRKRRSY